MRPGSNSSTRARSAAGSGDARERRRRVLEERDPGGVHRAGADQRERLAAAHPPGFVHEPGAGQRALPAQNPHRGVGVRGRVGLAEALEVGAVVNGGARYHDVAHVEQVQKRRVQPTS